MIAARSHSMSSERGGVSDIGWRCLSTSRSNLHTFVKIRLVEVVRPGNVHVIQTGNVSVPTEVLQQLDLSQGTLGKDLLAEHIGNLLDCNALTSLVVGSSADYAISTLS